MVVIDWIVVSYDELSYLYSVEHDATDYQFCVDECNRMMKENSYSKRKLQYSVWLEPEFEQYMDEIGW